LRSKEEGLSLLREIKSWSPLSGTDKREIQSGRREVSQFKEEGGETSADSSTRCLWAGRFHKFRKIFVLCSKVTPLVRGEKERGTIAPYIEPDGDRVLVKY